MTLSYKIAPSLDDFAAVARATYDALPTELTRHVDDVVICVDDFPDEAVQREMKLDSPFDLLGLYEGVALGDKSLTDPAVNMDMIFLYRRPILDYWCESGEDLNHLIRHVLIHEIGHHFGLSDEDMERIEANTDEAGA